MMLGLGERDEEVLAALADLRAAGCDLLTLGQYLQPSRELLPVKEFVSPENLRSSRPAPRPWASSMFPAGRWCAARITRPSSTHVSARLTPGATAARSRRPGR
jgi:hypothetical protein